MPVQIISPLIDDFRKKFFRGVSVEDWNSWKWQLRNRFSKTEDLRSIFSLAPEEEDGLKNPDRRLPLAITPYYAAVLASSSFGPDLRRIVIPRKEEFSICDAESPDPMGESECSPLPNIIHRYPDRLLFLITQKCAVYCRYCTRGRLAGRDKLSSGRGERLAALEYIKKHKSIREVIISGGDAFFPEDALLEEVLRELRRITHVEIIRLASRIPVVLPQRISDSLVKMLKKYHPLFLSLHAVHPEELTPEVKAAVEKLADAGIGLVSQTVLLRGINDSLATLKSLMEKLLTFRVRPYALYQCDPIIGSKPFRTSIEKGLELVEGLRLHSSGYALPHYMADPPGGKVLLAPNTIIGKSDGVYHLKNWKGEIVSLKV